MKARHLGLCLFLYCVVDALACPGCGYNRMLENNWHLKFFAFNLAVPILICVNRLNPIRMLFLFIPYVIFIERMIIYNMWHSYGRFHPAGITGILYDIFIAIVNFNLIGTALLFLMSRIKYFRWNKEKRLALWQPIAYTVVLAGTNPIIFAWGIGRL